MSRPKLLAMIDLSLYPDALAPIREVADVAELPVDRELLLKRIGEYDAYFGHTDIRRPLERKSAALVSRKVDVTNER